MMIVVLYHENGANFEEVSKLLTSAGRLRELYVKGKYSNDVVNA